MTENTSSYSSTAGKNDLVEAMERVVDDPNNKGLKQSTERD